MVKEKDGQWCLLSGSEEETEAWGSRLAPVLEPGDCLLLVGELGAGKTCFVRGIARGLGVKERVTSPTFILLREHRGRLPLYHLDAYRLEGPGDLYMLGLDELEEAGGVLAVEWGDRVRGFFLDDFLEIRIEIRGDSERELTFIPHGAKWEERLREVFQGSNGGQSTRKGSGQEG